MHKFDSKYFNQIYPKGETIDGDYNAKEHALYLKHLFLLMGVHISSVYDFGFGKGNLLKQVSKKLEVVHVGGCDISEVALRKLQKSQISKEWKLQVAPIDKVQLQRKYDLGICNSVLQYVDDKVMEKAISNMAKHCKYLYLQVPTKKDYAYLKKHLKFEDPYAKIRDLNFYNKRVKKYFTAVSYGLLESKTFFDYNKSVFQDELYRFE